MRPLNSDELGEKGELRFRELCNDENLTPNQVTRDRTGWDTLVEFPFDSVSNLMPLDRRPQPASCRAQVKTVWEGAKNIRLRLSSAERLAKLVEPTTIFVFEVNNEKEFRSLHCIHIMDDVLERILLEARKCQKARTPINQTFMRLKFAEFALCVDPNGRELRKFIESIQGGSRTEYITKKVHQINNLGVIGNRFSGTFSLLAKSDREFEDVMLGLKTGTITSFTADETRWGITLPVHREEKGELSVKPVPRKGQVVLRKKSPPEVVKMDVSILVPPIPSDKTKDVRVRLVNDVLDFVIERDGASFRLTSNTLAEKARSLKDHIKLNQFQTIMSSGSGVAEIFDGKTRVLGAEFETEAADDYKNFLFGKRLLEKIQVIVKAAGDGEIHLTVDDMNSQIGVIDMVYDLIDAPETVKITPIKISVVDGFPMDLHEVEALIMGRILFAHNAIAFCAIGQVTISDGEQSKTLTVGEVALRQVDLIGGEDEDYQQFDLDMQDETALRIVLKLGNYEDGVYREKSRQDHD